jgi:indolepyruvate ferredoxin oxidoreductase alpha subunit
VRKVLVLEELEPVLEDCLRALAQERGIDVRVEGKDEGLTRLGEYSCRLVGARLARFLDRPAPQEELCPGEKDLPGRPPNLCAGCSHRALYYAVRKVFGDEAVYSSDIGCYTLGFLPPLRTADFLFCMGSSISGGTGMARASGRPVIGFIGDSTFFHSGLTGLVNAVYNEHDILVVVLDNKTTAMTGHQPHPGVEHSSQGANEARVDIEQVVRGCGVENVRKVKPFNHKATLQVLQEFKDMSGVRVIIAEEPCVLFARRTLGRSRPQVASVTEDSPEVWRCMEEVACPAFYVRENRVAVDEAQCTGCMLCVQVCDSIKPRKRG